MIQVADQFFQNQRLGRGVNIVGYDPIWESYENARIQSRHFCQIREAGFNHVRINLHPFAFMGEGPNYTIKSTWLHTLDWMVVQCQRNGLLAILDLHEFTAMARDPMGLKPKFLAAWEQLSTRYQSADNTVFFELLNEPNSLITPRIWNEYLKAPLALIREDNPTRTVIIGPAYWNGIDYLHELELPENDPNIIVTVHYYHPMDFTHQGAYWSPEHCDKSGLSWLGSNDDLLRLRKDFDQVNAWALQHNRPIYLGEFGAYDKADMASRVRYTNAISREAESLGWSWGYWQFDSDFVVFDIQKDCWVEPIRNALIPA
jgi:endoglucanase